MGFMDNVKGFAAKVGNTVEKGAKSVSDNSKKIAEKSRVKREISQLETEMNNAYLAIGKKYFELHSAAPEEGYEDAVNTIIADTDKIEKFRLLLASMDDKQPCSSCGAEVVRGQKFCDKCGAKVEFVEPPVIEGYNDQPVNEAPEEAPAAADEQADQSEAESVENVCTGCGAALAPGQNFCEKCGTKIQ